MTDVMSKPTIGRLSSAYEHVDDIDLFTGGLAERPVVGGVVGPTFACILGQQFLNLRKGDRFWYENGGHDGQFPGGFTPDQLQEIRKSSLARVICNGLDDVGAIQPYAFLADDEFANRRSACKGSRIPRVDLQRWKEEQNTAKPTLFSAAPTLYSVLSLSSPSSQNAFGMKNNLPPSMTEKAPSKFSPLNFIHDQLTLTPSAVLPSANSGEMDKNFAQWLKDKETTQQLATDPEDGGVQQKVFLDEVPKPITRAQYYNVFKGDDGDVGAAGSGNKNDIALDFVTNGRSAKSKYAFRQQTGNDNFDAFVDDLFQSARKKAFEEKQLFYRK